MQEQAAAAARAQEPTRCWLCARDLGGRVEWHHPKPKSRGGRVTVPVHPICHRAIHANFDNTELERIESLGVELRHETRLEPFLNWIASKGPDFSAPTRHRR